MLWASLLSYFLSTVLRIQINPRQEDQAAFTTSLLWMKKIKDGGRVLWKVNSQGDPIINFYLGSHSGSHAPGIELFSKIFIFALSKACPSFLCL